MITAWVHKLCGNNMPHLPILYIKLRPNARNGEINEACSQRPLFFQKSPWRYNITRVCDLLWMVPLFWQGCQQISSASFNNGKINCEASPAKPDRINFTEKIRISCCWNITRTYVMFSIIGVYIHYFGSLPNWTCHNKLVRMFSKMFVN